VCTSAIPAPSGLSDGGANPETAGTENLERIFAHIRAVVCLNPRPSGQSADAMFCYPRRVAQNQRSEDETTGETFFHRLPAGRAALNHLPGAFACLGRGRDHRPGARRACRCGDLTQAQALDPRLRILVAQGLYDLVTPYYGNWLLLNLAPPVGAPDRIGFLALPGGHMFYAVDSSRVALRDAARKMISSE
jgi:hypothetical protein